MALILDFKDQAFYAFRSLCAVLCEAIYPVIGFAYELFIKLAMFELLSSNDVTEIYKRVTMVLTIIMIFYITFEFVKYIVQPDTMTDKEKGVSHLPMKVVSVVVLIAFVPNIFVYANKIQNAIIKNEVISKIILGKQNVTASTFGRNFAWSMLNIFYYEEFPDSNEDCDGVPCETVILMNESDLLNKGKLTYLTLGVNSLGEVEEEIGSSGATQSIEKPLIHFDALWAVLVGGFVGYMLILYCVDVGARVIQIAYLQLIAPIPIIGMLSPKKDNMFTKWLKQCAVTYLDVFIRLAIIYFVLLICQTLLNNGMSDKVAGADIYVKLALILGLLVFAKRVPKMVSELLPKSSTAASGNFGLKAGDRNIGRVIGSALGLTVGTAAGAATGLIQGARKVRSLDPNASAGKKAWAAISGGVTGTVRGGIGGAGRGLVNGAKKGNVVKNVSTGVKNQLKSNQTFGNKAEAGYTLGHQIQDKVGGMFGMSRTEELDKVKAPKERLVKERDSENEHRKKMSDKAFENAVVKGKGATNARVRNAVNEYKRLEQREKDLSAPDSALRQQYKAGLMRHDKVSEYRSEVTKRDTALAALNSADHRTKSDQELGIRKQDYINRQTGRTDTRAYEEARKAAYMRQEQAKINAQFEADVRTKGLVYNTQDEANAALISAQQELAAQKKKAKDQVQFAYEDWAINTRDAHGNIVVNDEEMMRWKREDEQREQLYNRSATAENKVNKEVEVLSTMMEMARVLYAKQNGILDANNEPNPDAVTAEQAESVMDQISRAEAEDKWVKETVANEKLEAQLVVNEATARQEEIKRETSGSSNKS